MYSLLPSPVDEIWSDVRSNSSASRGDANWRNVAYSPAEISGWANASSVRFGVNATFTRVFIENSRRLRCAKMYRRPKNSVAVLSIPDVTN